MDAGLGSLSAFISYLAFRLAFRKARSFSGIVGCEILKLITIATSVALVFFGFSTQSNSFCGGILNRTSCLDRGTAKDARTQAQLSAEKLSY